MKRDLNLGCYFIIYATIYSNLFFAVCSNFTKHGAVTEIFLCGIRPQQQKFCTKSTQP